MPGRRYADGDIARFAQRLDLAGEDRIIAEIVRRRRQQRRIGRKRDRRQRPAVYPVAADKLGREMLRIAGTAAIAEKHQLVAGIHRGLADIRETDEIRLQRTGRRDDSIVLFEFAIEIGVEIHGSVSVRTG